MRASSSSSLKTLITKLSFRRNRRGAAQGDMLVRITPWYSSSWIVLETSSSLLADNRYGDQRGVENPGGGQLHGRRIDLDGAFVVISRSNWRKFLKYFDRGALPSFLGVRVWRKLRLRKRALQFVLVHNLIKSYFRDDFSIHRSYINTRFRI